jgi:hypothetical protein
VRLVMLSQGRGHPRELRGTNNVQLRQHVPAQTRRFKLPKKGVTRISVSDPAPVRELAIVKSERRNVNPNDGTVTHQLWSVVSFDGYSCINATITLDTALTLQPLASSTYDPTTTRQHE